MTGRGWEEGLEEDFCPPERRTNCPAEDTLGPCVPADANPERFQWIWDAGNDSTTSGMLNLRKIERNRYHLAEKDQMQVLLEEGRYASIADKFIFAQQTFRYESL